ncbi:MAG: hypothetical protein ACTSU2_03965 [Promethearchaeota archaeon]
MFRRYITLYARDNDNNIHIVVFSGFINSKIKLDSKAQPGEKIDALNVNFVVIFSIGSEHFPSYPRFNFSGGWYQNFMSLRDYYLVKGWKNGRFNRSRVKEIVLPFYPKINEGNAKEIIEALEDQLKTNKDAHLSEKLNGLKFISDIKQFFMTSTTATGDIEKLKLLELLEGILYSKNIYLRKKLLDMFIELKPEEELVRRIIDVGNEELIAGFFLQAAYQHYFPEYLKRIAESLVEDKFEWTLPEFAQGIKRTIELYLYAYNKAENINAAILQSSNGADENEKVVETERERVKDELLDKLAVIEDFNPTLMKVYRLSSLKSVNTYYSKRYLKRIEKTTHQLLNVHLKPKFLKRIKEIDALENNFKIYAKWQHKVMHSYIHLLMYYIIGDNNDPAGLDERDREFVKKGDLFLKSIFIYIKDIFQKAVALDLPEVVGKCAYYYDTLLAKEIASELGSHRSYYYFKKLYLRQLRKYSKETGKLLRALKGFLSSYKERDYYGHIRRASQYFASIRHYLLIDVLFKFDKFFSDNLEFVLDLLPEIKLNLILDHFTRYLNEGGKIEEILGAKDMLSLIRLVNSTNNQIAEFFSNYLKKRMSSETEFNSDYLIELMEIENQFGAEIVGEYINKFQPKCSGYLLYRYFLMKNKKYWMQEGKLIDTHIKAATEDDVFNFMKVLLENFTELYLNAKKGKVNGHIRAEEIKIFNDLISENILKSESDKLDTLIGEILEIIIFMIEEYSKSGTFDLNINLSATGSDLGEEEGIYDLNKFLSDLYVFFLNNLFSIDLSELKKLKEKHPIEFKELEELSQSHFIGDETSRHLIYFLSALNSNRAPPSHVIKSVLFKGLTNIKNKMVEYLNLTIDKWIKDPYIVLQCLEVGISSLINNIDKHFEEIPDEIETDGAISRHVLGKRSQTLFLILDSPVRTAFEFGLRKLEKLYSPIDKDLTTKEGKEAIATKIPYNILIRLLEHPAPEVKSWLSGRFHDLINNIEKYIDDSDEIRLQRSIDLFLYYTKTIIYFPNRFSKERLNVYDALYRLALKYKENKEIINKIQNTLLEAGASNVQVNSDNALLTLAKILEVVEK